MNLHDIVVFVVWLLIAGLVYWGGITISAKLAQPLNTVLYVVTILLTVALAINAVMALAGRGFVNW